MNLPFYRVVCAGSSSILQGPSVWHNHRRGWEGEALQGVHKDSEGGHVCVCVCVFLQYICSAQSGNLRILEIALCILRILRLCSNLEIAQITHDRETTFASASEWFSYLACRPAMNGIVGGQHGSTALRHFVRSNFSRFRREAHEKQKSVYQVAWTNKYKCTAIKCAQLLRIAWHKTSQKPSVAHQHTALLFQIAIWRQAPVIKAVFHPASYTSTADAHLQADWQSGNS